ncbi:MAG TPA: hypothetical protein VK524_18695 [Polyangiaceae bacterium]|nr:hypothetical protein [Polyangiaceae bacterium]
MKSKRVVFGTFGALCALVAVLVLWVTRAGAGGVPATGALTYSGVLEDANGALLTGSKEIRIELFDAVSGGAVKCTVAQTVALSGGRFQVVLPDTCGAAIAASPDLWIEVVVDGASLGRTKLGAVPYALEAARASAATGQLSTQVVPAGAVMAFDLAACPAGWSPVADAAGRVVVGSTTGLARGAKLGADQVTLTAAQMPAHAHGVSDPGHAHTVPNVVDYGLEPTFVQGGTQGVGRSPIGSSTNPTGITIQSAGGGQAFDNRQASLALLYCKKN